MNDNEIKEELLNHYLPCLAKGGCNNVAYMRRQRCVYHSLKDPDVRNVTLDTLKIVVWSRRDALVKAHATRILMNGFNEKELGYQYLMSNGFDLKRIEQLYRSSVGALSFFKKGKVNG